MSAKDFLSTPFFMNRYVNIMGQKQAETTISRLKSREIPTTGYQDITRKVSYSRRDEVKSEVQFSDVKPRYRFAVDDTTIVFDYDSFIRNTSVLVFPAELRTQETMSLIGRLATVYGISADHMRVLVKDCVNLETMEFNSEKLKLMAERSKPDITSAKDPYSLPPVSFLMAKQKDRFLDKLGTIYNSGGDYEKGVNDAFVEEAGKKGITITTQQGYADGDVDFNGQLTAIIATSPDAIFCPNYYQDDGKIVTQARQQGYKGVFMGADGWSNIVGGSEEYASAEDLEGCYYDCSFVSENPDEKVQKFISDYKAKFNDEPSNFCALGYDAAMVMANAIETVEKDGKAKAGTADYSQAIIDAIASGSVDGVTGTIKYEGTGDPVKPTLVITFKGGAQEVFQTVEAES